MSDTKYGKTILHQENITVNGMNVVGYVLDAGDCYNIHVWIDVYKDEELNTLYMQEPKNQVPIEDVCDKPFLLGKMMEMVLWHICYGYKRNMYSFDINISDACPLDDEEMEYEPKQISRA